MSNFLVVGDVCGKFDTLFKRVSRIVYNKGGFLMLFCVGDFFGKSYHELNRFLNGEKNIPIPTFFIVGNEKSTELIDDIPNGGEICHNLTFLGRCGIKNINGFEIGYISGIYRDKIFNSNKKINYETFSPYYTKEQLKLDTYKNVDILLTSEWPNGVHKLVSDKKFISKFSTLGIVPIAEFSSKISPRYHFAAKNNIFFEFIPYKNDFTSVKTRIVVLGKYGIRGKKSLYGFKFTNENDEVIDNSSNICVLNPFTRKIPFIIENTISTNKKKKNNDSGMSRWAIDPPEGYICENCKENGHWIENCPLSNNNTFPSPGYVCKICKIPGHFITNCPQKQQNYFKRDNDPFECWFCLGSESIESHLIISIAEYSYLAITKGPINKFHCLIIPQNHCEKYVDISGDILAEIEKYKNSLREMANNNNLNVLFFVRDIYQLNKTHVFVEAVFLDQMQENNFINNFKKETTLINLKIDYLKDGDLKNNVEEGVSYLYIESSSQIRMLVQITNIELTHLVFIRKVLCESLDLEERVNWRKCVGKKDEEERMTEEFKVQFKDYDFITD